LIQLDGFFAKRKEIIDYLCRHIKNTTCLKLFCIFYSDSFEYHWKNKEEKYGQYNTHQHISNTVPGGFDLVWISSRKNKQKNSIKECVQ